MSFGAWANLQELEAAGTKSTKVGNEEMPDRVRWIRSYVVKEPDGRLGTFCIYQAQDPKSIREHARRVGVPGDQIFPVVKPSSSAMTRLRQAALPEIVPAEPPRMARQKSGGQAGRAAQEAPPSVRSWLRNIRIDFASFNPEFPI